MAKPILDVRTDDNELCVSVELPGVDSSGLDVHIDGDSPITPSDCRPC
jgi:HSP20 family molecular chaperone IbpA